MFVLLAKYAQVSHEQTLPTQTKYNDNVIASSHQDIEHRHLIVPIIEELELPK